MACVRGGVPQHSLVAYYDSLRAVVSLSSMTDVYIKTLLISIVRIVKTDHPALWVRPEISLERASHLQRLLVVYMISLDAKTRMKMLATFGDTVLPLLWDVALVTRNE